MLAGALSLVLFLGAGAPRQEALTLPELVDRDTRISFTSDSARRARAALERGGLEPEIAAVAAVAVASGHSSSDVPRLVELSSGDDPVVRRAAFLALGEMGAAGVPELERALATDVDGIEGVLCAALVVAERRGASGARALLEQLAPGSDALAENARAALTATHEGADVGVGLTDYYVLRWRAARLYGLVDGQRGQRAFALELCAQPDFVAAMVLGSIDELAPAEIEAHLTELVLGDGGAPALRAAARVAPGTLAALHRAGAWHPTVADWQVVLGEIESEHVERDAFELVELAFDLHEPELELPAGMLLVRAGGDVEWPWVAASIERAPPEIRSRIVEACGERGAREWASLLGELVERRRDLGLEGESLVALTRLGWDRAESALSACVTGAAGPERDAVVPALARVLDDAELRPYAARLLERPDLASAERTELETGLVLAGAWAPREHLRTALIERKYFDRRRLVRALAVDPEQEDLDLLTTIFPVENAFDLDVELAVALIRLRHLIAVELLRAALWNGSFNISVLAGGLIVRAGGLQSLLDEIDAAPRTMSAEALRRAGYAYGEWGGLGAVEDLSRTRVESDPVLQGALLGALSSRASEPTESAVRAVPPREKPTGAKGGGKGGGPRKGKGKGKKGGA